MSKIPLIYLDNPYLKLKKGVKIVIQQNSKTKKKKKKLQKKLFP